MQLKEAIEAFEYKIVGGAEFQWSCWPNARYIDFDSEYGDASVTYNTQTQRVYSLSVSPASVSVYADQRPYRWTDPEFKQAHDTESNLRGVDPTNAWDDVQWVDLETPEDFLVKANAIFNGEPFDTRIEVPLNLSDEDFTRIAKMAHENDITFNSMVENILRRVIDQLQNKKDCGNACTGCKCKGIV